MQLLSDVWSLIASHWTIIAVSILLAVLGLFVGALVRGRRSHLPADYTQVPVQRASLRRNRRIVLGWGGGGIKRLPVDAEPPEAPPADAGREKEETARDEGPVFALGWWREEEEHDREHAALEIEAGKLAYQIPDEMWRGTPEIVEVRLGRQEAQGMMMGFVGSGEVKTAETSIVETMSITLLGDDDVFLIEPRSERDQLVKRDLVKGTAFQGDDFGRWVWRVTPKQTGQQTLLVKISAVMKDSRGLPTTSSLPDKVFSVAVRVHVMRATTAAIRRAVPALAWVVVTTLVGIFTRDYWWPFVRDLIGLG